MELTYKKYLEDKDSIINFISSDNIKEQVKKIENIDIYGFQLLFSLKKEQKIDFEDLNDTLKQKFDNLKIVF